ncbi:MAG: histidine phosphatase family protein [Candidatus Thorarchaeota archaeon]|nr:histidine phosphatase family protein [Candidatus Thorarchaeota archaeon]
MFDLIQERDEGPIMGSRTTIYIVIPAETNNKTLTERGVGQLDDLVHSRMITSTSRVYTPPTSDERLTAEHLANEFGVEVKQVDNLAEVAHGGKGPIKKETAEIIRAMWTNPEFVPHHGESIEQAENRIAEAMNKIVSQHRNDSITVVLPPMIGTLFLSLVMGGVPSIEQWLALGHASCAMFEYQRSSWSLVFPLDNSYLSDPSTVQESFPEEIIRLLLQ